MMVVGAVALTEGSAKHLPFAIAALLFNAALLLIFVADLDRAILLSGLLAIAIAGASTVKFDHSAIKLTISDIPLAFAGTVPFLVLQYPRAMLGILIGGVLFVAASIAVLLYAAGPPISMACRLLLFCVALIGFATAAAVTGGSALADGADPAARLLLDLYGLTRQPCLLATVQRACSE